MKKLFVEDIIKDINAGLGDIPIMEKYDISSGQLMDILERLNNVRSMQSMILRTSAAGSPAISPTLSQSWASDGGAMSSIALHRSLTVRAGLVRDPLFISSCIPF